MPPIYAHCPFCGYPVVVRLVERLLPRYCRQCRAQYVPGVTAPANLKSTAKLRARVRSRVRAAVGLNAPARHDPARQG